MAHMRQSRPDSGLDCQVKVIEMVSGVSSTHPRISDEQLGAAVGAIHYVRGSGN